MNKPVILAAGTPQMLLPYDNANRFVRDLARHRGPLASWTAWVAPTTLKPAEAAQPVGMGEAELREVNRIPPRMLVQGRLDAAGAARGHTGHDVAESIADNAVMALAPEAAAARGAWWSRPAPRARAWPRWPGATASARRRWRSGTGRRRRPASSRASRSC